MKRTECGQGFWNEIDMDIRKAVYQAASQVPKGMITTYQDIAKALGDPVAARLIGELMSHNPTPIVVPCHRVVYSTGEVGWYDGKGKGQARKIELLAAEGVRVEGRRIKNFERLRFSDFRINPILSDLRREQDRLRDAVIEEDAFGKLRYVAGLDVSYKGDRAFSALVKYDWSTGDIIERRTSQCTVSFPYIPTYLSFREIPALSGLITERNEVVYLIDGQGVLHPRGLGIASHIGVALDIATIGAAKSMLVGQIQEEEKESSPILLDGRVRGHLLSRGAKRTFVSVGHKVSLETAVRICQRFLNGGVPQPLREAHRLANRTRIEAGE